MSETSPLIPDVVASPLSHLTSEPVRQAFIRKVYIILSILVLSSYVVSVGFMRYTLKTPYKILLPKLICAAVLFLASLAVILCCRDLMRSFPLNYVLLILVTLSKSVLIGYACSFHLQDFLYVGGALLVAVVVSLTLYACLPSLDFMASGPYVLCLIASLFSPVFAVGVASLLKLEEGRAFRPLGISLEALCCCLVAFYLVHKTQLIAAGEHQYQFSVDDHVLAVVTFGSDILNMLLSPLRCCFRRQESSSGESSGIVQMGP